MLQKLVYQHPVEEESVRDNAFRAPLYKGHVGG